MSTDLYWAACTYAGAWRRGYLPHGVNLLSSQPRFPLVRKAIYIACDRTGRVAYVGKVSRDLDMLAVSSRLREHQLDGRRSDEWAQLYVVPLRGDTPDEVVEYIEAVTIHMLEPYQNDRQPDLLRFAVSDEPSLVDLTSGA